MSEMSSSRSEVWDVPEWLVLGESVHIRLTSSTGVVAYLGPAHFAPGTWVGVELDTPTGEITFPTFLNQPRRQWTLPGFFNLLIY